MLYHILYEFLYPLNHLWAPLRVLNVFQYITFRTAYASLTALLISLLLGPWLITRLREFQIGQQIREEGPKSHQKKAGTPTMGGVLIVVSIIVPTLLWQTFGRDMSGLLLSQRSPSAPSVLPMITSRSSAAGHSVSRRVKRLGSRRCSVSASESTFCT